jgi:hypothetical protein
MTSQQNQKTSAAPTAKPRTEEETYAAFERDVPEALRDEVITMMSEATSGCGDHECVTILEHDRIDAINHQASGTIVIEGKEYAFQMADGCNAGTILLSWNDEEADFERHVPIRWTLQPDAEAVAKSLESGRGALLIAKWDIMMKWDQVAKIVTSYAYDSHFAPGFVTDRHWRDKAARHGLVLVDEETAAATRKRLAA